MLATCGLLLFSLGGLKAQSYTPVAYNFGPVMEVPDGTLAGPTNLGIDCLAANGYGQWGSSYKPQNLINAPGLYLLDNSLQVANLFQGTSVVGATPFVYDAPPNNSYPVDGSNHAEIKCTANLNGSVRYVWLTSDHQHFFVEGFDECGPNDKWGINLQFADFPFNSNYGTGDELLAEQVIKPPVSEVYPKVDASINGIFHSVVTSTNENNPKDWFDIAIDAEYLYIVWEEYNTITQTYNIWAKAIDLYNPANVEDVTLATGGIRPTIAADLRRNEYPAFTPCFDVAYITTAATPGVVWYNSEGGTVTTIPLATSYQDPGGNIHPYTWPSHARVLVGSCELQIGANTTPRSIYVIAQDGLTHDAGKISLFMHKVKALVPDPQAYYCDGWHLTFHSTGVDDGPWAVIDNPIRAFANPYDGEESMDFDEYHCMYQLSRTYTLNSIPYSHSPLMLIHGAMVYGSATMTGPKACLNYAGTNTTPGTVTQRPDIAHAFYADPGANSDGGYTDNYVGAVNQMGIHLHWRNGTEHYYLRDIRKFDENIEENTLASEDVYIDDGTSHGGDFPPTLQPGKTMTLWSDPTNAYGYSPSPVCTVNFPTSTSDETELVIGAPEEASNLVTLRHIIVNASNRAQQIHVMPSSTVDWFTDREDCFEWPEGGLKLEGTGASMQTTVGDFGYPYSIVYPATLNIYSGCIMYLGPNSIFDANTSCINIQAGRQITVAGFSIPEYNWQTGQLVGYANPLPYPGSIVPYSGCYITDCIYQTLDRSNDITTAPILTFFGSPSWATTSEEVQITNSHFQGYFSQVQSNLFGLGTGANPPPWPEVPITITGGEFDGTVITICHPLKSTTINGVTFDYVPQVDAGVIFPSGSGAINFQGIINGYSWAGLSNYAYDQQTITGCQFHAFAQGARLNGIYVREMQSHVSTLSSFQITDNDFSGYSGDGDDLNNAAIKLEFSQAVIENNIVTDPSWGYGIQCGQTAGFNELISNSLICNNDIMNSRIAGMSTANWQGYGKLNRIHLCASGHQFFGGEPGQNPHPFVIFSNYHDNSGPGIDVGDLANNSFTYSQPDLSGVHSVDGTQDYAAMDTIQNNEAMQIHVCDGGMIWLGLQANFGWQPWSDWSRNNILESLGQNGTELNPLIVSDYGFSPPAELGDISKNYWGKQNGNSGPLVNPIYSQQSTCGTGLLSAPSTWLNNPDNTTRALTFCYSVPTTEPICTQMQGPAGTIYCGDVNDIAPKKKGAAPQSALSDTSCQAKYELGIEWNGSGSSINGDTQDYIQAYRCLRSFCETCYDTVNSSWGIGALTAAVDGMSTDLTTYENYREWLKSVLWLNRTDPMWYCTCVGAIGHTYLYDSANNGEDLNAMISICRFMLQTKKCPHDSAFYAESDSVLPVERHADWLDTVVLYHHGDTVNFPQDTTIPSIHDLGLDILLGPPANASAEVASLTGIGALIANPNPFRDETSVTFDMSQSAYVSFQVFDLLGRVVQGDYKGTVLSPGIQSFRIDGSKLASGTYYARITTPTGDTRTVKLTKE